MSTSNAMSPRDTAPSSKLSPKSLTLDPMSDGAQAAGGAGGLDRSDSACADWQTDEESGDQAPLVE